MLSLLRRLRMENDPSSFDGTLTACALLNHMVEDLEQLDRCLDKLRGKQTLLLASIHEVEKRIGVVDTICD